MQSIEPRNEQLMLRQFWKKHPTYNLNAMMRRSYEQLMDAKAFNQWLADRRLKQEGEEYADAMGRVTEAVTYNCLAVFWYYFIVFCEIFIKTKKFSRFSSAHEKFK